MLFFLSIWIETNHLTFLRLLPQLQRWSDMTCCEAQMIKLLRQLLSTQLNHWNFIPLLPLLLNIQLFAYILPVMNDTQDIQAFNVRLTHLYFKQSGRKVFLSLIFSINYKCLHHFSWKSWWFHCENKLVYYQLLKFISNL